MGWNRIGCPRFYILQWGFTFYILQWRRAEMFVKNIFNNIVLDRVWHIGVILSVQWHRQQLQCLVMYTLFTSPTINALFRSKHLTNTWRLCDVTNLVTMLILISLYRLCSLLSLISLFIGFTKASRALCFQPSLPPKRKVSAHVVKNRLY